MKQTVYNLSENRKTVPVKDLVIAIKGAGEMATGIAHRLFRSNIKNIFMMETDYPLAVRRKVSFCEAVLDEVVTVEGVTARRVSNKKGIHLAWQDNEIPVVADPSWTEIDAIGPHVVVDAIIAKRNLGTTMAEAPLVIGLGPGFDAGFDVHLVIETNRGHNMGKVIRKGPAEPNTGIPGDIGGKTIERVLRAPCKGIFETDLHISNIVKEGQIIGRVNDMLIFAQTGGMVRGLIRNHTTVKRGLKIGDIDPRSEDSFYDRISEKSRAIGGAVLEAVLSEFN